MEPMSDQVGASAAFDLTGRSAVVTGAGSGIGRATANVLAGAGASLVLGDIDEGALTEVATAIRARTGREVVAARADVTRRADVEHLVALAVSHFGTLDIMCNIAGVASRNLVADITEDEFDRVVAINVKGVLFGCQAAIAVMIPKGAGTIVNIASAAIDTPAATLGVYAMSKASVAILTKVLAAEVGQAGIRVNCLAPGIVLSNFSRPHFVDEAGKVREDKREAFKQRASNISLVGRIGDPADIAWSILYLVSDAASFVTGQTMRPNGGVAMP